MIRVLIVDDEPLARRGIRRLLESEKDFTIVGEESNGYAAVAAIESIRPDLVFLDVQMPMLDGLSLVEKIGVEYLPEVVFVTAYDEHAIRAFDAGAIDYILKPINPERFQKTLDRVRNRISSGENRTLGSKITNLIDHLKRAEPDYLDRIAVRKDERIRFLNIKEVAWITSQGNYIEIHSGNNTFLLRETMDRIERKLNPQEFLRIRRSTIVRIENIKELQTMFSGEYTVILTDGTELSTSRRYRKNLESFLKL